MSNRAAKSNEKFARMLKVFKSANRFVWRRRRGEGAEVLLRSTCEYYSRARLIAENFSCIVAAVLLLFAICEAL